MECDENITSDNQNINNDLEQLINLVLTTSENANTSNHQDSLHKLLQAENNEIKLISNILEILSNYNQYIYKLTSLQNLQLLIYIKNILQRFKAKPQLKQIINLEQKVLSSINFYINFNFNNKDNSDFNKIKKIYDDSIISSLFDLIVIMKESKKFLKNIYEQIILIFLNHNNNNNTQSNNIISHETIIKFIFVYENFCRIYLIYIMNNKEIKIVFDKFKDILLFCKSFISNIITNNNKVITETQNSDMDELNARLINQCILSFSKTSMLSLDHFIKSQIFLVSSGLEDDNEKPNNKFDNRFIFINNNSFLEFIHLSLYYDDNKNNFTFGIEYPNIKEKKFDFLISKGKGILIEALTVLVKKLTKYDYFKSCKNFNNMVFNYYCEIIEYSIKFYQKVNYPREKVDNVPEEIIQLSVLVKIINFIDEIIDNQIYKDLIETNLFKINSSNKNEKYSDIFKYIIVPNLLPTELEKNLFEFDENEYINNLFDMCHTCEVKLPKQKSIKLLMTLCDSVDDFFSIIIHVYVLILKNITLTNNNNNNNNSNNIKIEDKYQNLYNFLVQNISSFNLIEQSLQVLTSISYLFANKPEVADYFCDEIDLINYMLIKITDPFLKSKLCVFYSYNLEILFHNDDEVLSKSFDDSLNFLFDCIYNKDPNPSLVKTCLNCLNEIIFNKYLKKFCVTSVCINALKVLDFFNVKEHMSGNEEEFNEFLKGLIKEYMYDLGDTSIQLFDLSWDKFLNTLNISEKNKKDLDNFNKNIKAGILKDKTKEINIATELSTQINTIKNFINMIKNKNIEIKNNIYEKILTLFQNIHLYINSDFEEEILQLISMIIIDVKLLPDSYFTHLQNFLKVLNKENNNDYIYAIEKYHLDFIFTCLQCFKRNIIINENIKEVLINNLGFRLSIVHRCIPLRKIYSEHYIYCDMGLCIDIFFFDNLTNSDICKLISIFYKRMEKIPNTDYDLNVKLCLNIFLLLIKSENYEIYDEIFLNNKHANLYNLLCKVISFFPFKSLSLTQQKIVSIFCSLIIRYMIIKQKNNQRVLSDENNVSDIDIQKIFFYIFSLNLNQLNIIKNKSMNIISKYEKKEEELNQNLLNKEVIIDSYEINENNGKDHFKKPTKMVYIERTPHNYSLFKKYDNLNEENSDNIIDYQAKEDDFLINDEFKDFKKDEKNKYKYNEEDYDDENINPLCNEDEDNSDDLSNNIDEKSIDDKDEEFLTIKSEPKNNFMHYYNKYANEELIVYLKKINEFYLFEIMMKDIEINDKNFLDQLLNQIKTTQGESKLKLIEQFKGLQKIEFKNKNIFSYRKIVKIQKSQK